MKSEMKDMTARELNYEPHLAFFTWNDDPLIFYKQIADIASRRLKQGGKLYFEINELMGDAIVKLLENKGFKNVVLKKDLNGKDRMISCCHI
jgi:release factor glutamine methyltransferase